MTTPGEKSLNQEKKTREENWRLETEDTWAKNLST